VKPTFGSLFAGIGGIDLGLERAGWKCIWQVEIDEFCQGVLNKHWPNVPKYRDVKNVGKHNLETPDLIAGGFPCQPVSLARAGKQEGVKDERWLWPEFYRVIFELQPRYVFVENVPGLYHRGFGEIITDLAKGGYDAEWDCIPAAALGAPHLRYRVFIVAYPGRLRWGRRGNEDVQREGGALQIERPGAGNQSRILAHAKGTGQLREKQLENDSKCQRGRLFSDDPDKEGEIQKWAGLWAVEPRLGRVAHGVPSRVDRLKALGNAVVPQVAEWIGRRMLEYANQT